MLLNNFKPLLWFGSDGSFVDVSGTSVDVIDFIQSLYTTSSNNFNLNSNGRRLAGATRSFNYNATTATNSYTDEQTAYTWNNIVGYANYNSGLNFSDKWYLLNGFIMFLGTGDTPVTADDYKLENPINLNVTGASCTTNNGIITVTRTFQNNTGSDVIIKEKGTYIFKHKVSTITPTTSYAVMIARKVLDTPVTIPAGYSRTFSTVIDMSQVTFTEAADS